jgi:peroxiredoxin
MRVFASASVVVLAIGCSGTQAAPAARGVGTDVGDVIEDHGFQGRRSGLSSPRETITLSSFKGDGRKLLLVNVAALWCSPCREEARELQNSLVPAYGPKGVAVMTVVLQNASRDPATDEDADNWMKTFGLTFPVVSDEAGFMNDFFDPNSMPLNLVVDLSNMKIVAKNLGADLSRVKASLDRALGG